MSDTYCVTMTPVFRAGGAEHFCKTIHDELSSRVADGIVSFKPGLETYNFEDPFDSFAALTGGHSQRPTIEADGTWCAIFDASYGWFEIMVDIFREAAKGLAAGGRIEILSYATGNGNGGYEYYVDGDHVYCREDTAVGGYIEDCGPTIQGGSND